MDMVFVVFGVVLLAQSLMNSAEGIKNIINSKVSPFIMGITLLAYELCVAGIINVAM